MRLIRENAAMLAEALGERYEGKRLIVAIAGAPGSGKSALAEALAAAVNADAPGRAAVLPMDGFHYDDTVLEPLGLLPRKGAVETFDVGGFVHLLGRLRDNEEETVAVPVFDRSIEIARAGARLIPRSTGIIVAEGNYLLMRREPWDRLRPLFDVTVMIDTDSDTLRRRLTRRWEREGLPADEVRRRVEENDLPNARTVMTGSAKADYRVAS